MVQSSTSLKRAGHIMLNWAAVIVLVLAVIIFTAIRKDAFFSCDADQHPDLHVYGDHLCHGGHRLHGPGWI